MGSLFGYPLVNNCICLYAWVVQLTHNIGLVFVKPLTVLET